MSTRDTAYFEKTFGYDVGSLVTGDGSVVLAQCGLTWVLKSFASVPFACAVYFNLIDQGFIYLSNSHLCFHSNLSSTKEDSSWTFFNCIVVTTNDGMDYWFGSFINRALFSQALERELVTVRAGLLTEATACSLDSEQDLEELKLHALDFDEPYEEPSNWVLTQAMVLSLCVYHEDVKESLESSTIPHHITGIAVSDEGFVDGRFVLAEASQPSSEEGGQAQPYIFVCFRGTKNLEDLKTDLDARPSVCPLGVVHSGFLERINKFPLRGLVTESARKRIVFTGHSLGGACAILLAARFFSEFGNLRHDPDHVLCVTFGSPLVAGPTLGVYMIPRRKHFHNYINHHDAVPRIMTVMDVILPWMANIAMGLMKTINGGAAELYDDIVRLSYYKPFGLFYRMDGTRPHLRPAVMTNRELKDYFENGIINRRVSDQMLTDHMMQRYVNIMCNGAVGLFVPVAFAPVHNVLRLKGSLPVVISSVKLKENRLHFYGSNLTYASACYVFAQPLVFVSADARQAVFECPEGVSSRLTNRQTISAVVKTAFGESSDDGPFSFTIAENTELLTPDRLLREVLPLVSLLVRQSPVEGAPHTRDVLLEMFHHCKAIGDSIPVEFAFRTLGDRSIADDGNSVVVTAFLNRLSQVSC